MNQALQTATADEPAFPARLRRFVVATSIPPFKQLYIGVYRALIWLVARRLYRHPDVLAVYITRGCGRGEIVPGISDIDMRVIVRDGSGPPEYELFQNRLEIPGGWYERLARATHLFEEHVSTCSVRGLLVKYRTRYHHQYRFMEGKLTWELLAGQDYVTELPAFHGEAFHGALYTEVQWWWQHFINIFLVHPERARDPITRDSVCYRVLSDCLKAAAAMRTGEVSFLRAGALERGKLLLTTGEREFIDQMQEMHRRRFLSGGDADTPEKTKTLLLNCLNRFHGELRRHTYLRPLKPASVLADCPSAEWQTGKLAAPLIEQLVEHLNAEWPETYRGARVTPSVFFDLDEVLLLIEVDPDRLPTVEQLQALNRLYRDTRTERDPKLYLFLLLPNACFRIGLERLRNMGWQNILCPDCTPDVYTLLREPAFTIKHGGYQPPEPNAWTPLVEFFCWTFKLRYRQVLEAGQAKDWVPSDFLRSFWKCLQLIVLDRSSRGEEIVFALTPEATVRQMDRLGAPLPPDLAELVDLWRPALQGEPVDVSEAVPSAISFLEEIDPGGARFENVVR